MNKRIPSVVFLIVTMLVPLYGAGYLSSLDHLMAEFFDSVLSPSTSTLAAGPSPREMSLRRLVDRTARLLEAEGRPLDHDHLMEIARIADQAALEYRLSPSLILSVIHSESRFDVTAVSPAGAIGLMQIQVATARHIAEAVGLQVPTSFHLFKPELNIHLGAGYLRFLIDRFDGDLRTALAAYHVGPTEISRRMMEQEPFSDHYGRTIRRREHIITTAAPVALIASARLPEGL